MFKFLLLAAAAVATTVSTADGAPAITPSPIAERDAQCLTLALAAVGVEKNQTKQQGIVAEAWYFLGRLTADAPGLDLNQATAKAFDAMKGDPHAKDIGSQCDAEFVGRGTDLAKLGSQ